MPIIFVDPRDVGAETLELSLWPNKRLRRREAKRSHQQPPKTSSSSGEPGLQLTLSSLAGEGGCFQTATAEL